MRLLLIMVMTVIAQAQDWTPKKVVAITLYPALARQARIQGDVVVNCFLDDKGNVVRTEPVSGHPLLQAQAKLNALLWKFQRITASLEKETHYFALHLSSLEGGVTIRTDDLRNRPSLYHPNHLIRPPSKSLKLASHPLPRQTDT